MVAWKTPKQFAWLCNDVNIYCHCHRHRKITQIQPGSCTCSLCRVTYSTLPLALNLRDVASELVSMRWIFHSAKTLLGEEGNQWLTYLGSCFLLHRSQLGLSLIGVNFPLTQSVFSLSLLPQWLQIVINTYGSGKKKRLVLTQSVVLFPLTVWLHDPVADGREMQMAISRQRTRR